MANRIYLAFYKHKRSFLKEPLKAVADAVTRFLQRGNTHTASQLLSVQSLELVTTMHMRLYLTVTQRLSETVVSVVNRLM